MKYLKYFLAVTVTMQTARLSTKLAQSFGKKSARKQSQLWLNASFSSLPNDPVIVSFARTPITSFQGDLSSMSAPELGSVAIKEAISKANIQPSDIGEAFLGNVVSAGIGQAPARQAVLGAGIPNSVPCTTVNKVCASGLKSIALAAQSVMTGHQDVVLAGGFESMSNIPYYLLNARGGYRLGDGKAIDGLVHDGLWDPYNDQHMGICAEKCSSDYDISREDQDTYAIKSYERAKYAWENGLFEDEVVEVETGGRKPKTVSVDEEFTGLKLDRIPNLKPAFKRDGTVTAANSSKINDGAAATIVMSSQKAKELGVTPLARIIGFGDAAKDPVDFTTAPTDAVAVALKHAGLQMGDIDYHEINEAFSVVALANIKLMNIDPETVNVNGGAVALGHPIGMSGCRITGSMMSVLKQKDGTFGAISICNGGGGAGAMILERI